MNAEQILELLTRCGFDVAARPFRERTHHCRRDGQNCSIDFATGQLSIWGTTRVLSLDDVAAEFGGERQEAKLNGEAAVYLKLNSAFVLTFEQQAWLDRCKRAGFVITDGPRAIAGCCSATHGGEHYELLPQVGQILGRGFKHHRLIDFMPPAEITTTGRSKQAALFGEDGDG